MKNVYVSTTFYRDNSKIKDVLNFCKKHKINNLELGSNHCYSKNFLNKILLAGFFSILVAGSTSVIAWLLDPAIKKIFIEKDEQLIFIIPVFIILSFAAKGISLYFAKSTMIMVGEEIKKILHKSP